MELSLQTLQTLQTLLLLKYSAHAAAAAALLGAAAASECGARLQGAAAGAVAARGRWRCGYCARLRGSCLEFGTLR